MQSTIEPILSHPNISQIGDLKLASSKMSGAERRSFQAAMTLKYCKGNARLAENVFDWGRNQLMVATSCGI